MTTHATPPIDPALLARAWEQMWKDATRPANGIAVSPEDLVAVYNRLAAAAAQTKVPGWLTREVFDQADAAFGEPKERDPEELAALAASFRVLLTACLTAHSKNDVVHFGGLVQNIVAALMQDGAP